VVRRLKARPAASSGPQIQEELPAMAETRERGDYIPFSRANIHHLLLADGAFAPASAERFMAFCRILQSLYHFEFHARLEELKETYGPFNPDTDEAAARDPLAERLAQREERLDSLLEQLLESANYQEIPRARL
jgi:hypothetical protein